MKPVGIIGHGTVGRATALLFKETAVYDPPQGFTDPRALRDCPVSFICVPTPTVGGNCDLSYVEKALENVIPHLSQEQVLAIRSTVPPGTVRRLQALLPSVFLASNPEFLRAHLVQEDALKPHRVVIGADNNDTKDLLFDLYRRHIADKTPIIVTDSVTAELTKYAANCYLAVKIRYAQQIHAAAAQFGAHYEDVAWAIGLDPRIGAGEEWFLPRLDDECLPKDLEAFVSLLRSCGGEPQVLAAVLAQTELDVPL